MKKDLLFISFIIIIALAAVFDFIYTVFAVRQIILGNMGEIFISNSFNGFSIAAICVNAALLIYTVIYLIIRKK